MKSSENEKWMREALCEAAKGQGLTAPNPPVGAVIIKGGQELARGWHGEIGSLHAERVALSKLKEGEAREATIYVTLEPCSTKGRTGACTTALLEAGVARVIYGARDPNPDHVGRADEILGSGGIEFVRGALEEECCDLIRGFASVQTKGRPWVIAKTAMSLDGRITRPPGEGQWLSGEPARDQVQRLRGEVDAILTSGETVRRDDPALTLRGQGMRKGKIQPWRVVMTRLAPSEWKQSAYQIFTDEWKERTLLFRDESKYEILRTLAVEHGVNTILLEAGGSLLGSFLDEGLIDEWVIYLTPMVTGGPNAAVAGKGAAALEERLSLKKVTIERVGRDLCARGLVDRDEVKHLDR